jgi:hypothetical protein
LGTGHRGGAGWGNPAICCRTSGIARNKANEEQWLADFDL